MQRITATWRMGLIGVVGVDTSIRLMKEDDFRMWGATVEVDIYLFYYN